MVFERTGKIGPGVLAVGFLALVVVVIVGWVVVPMVITSMIRKEARLEEGTVTWDKWKDIPVPIYFKVYVFHVANADDVEQNGATPILVEKGPYSYLEERHKVNISFEADGELISYRQNMTYHFDPAVSSESDEERFDVINIPFVTAATLGYKFFGTVGANIVISAIVSSGGQESIIKRGVSVRELIFDGIDVSAYTRVIDSLQPLIPSLNLRSLLPKQFIGDTFALYNGRNNTDVGRYTIYSGVGDYMKFGEIFSIDGSEYLNFWSGKTCNMINGSDTTIFHSSYKKDQPLTIFHSDVCRSFTGFFETESEYEGIPSYRFVVPEDLLLSPTVNPDNRCFCPEAKNSYENNCLRTGAIRLSTCYSGAPVVMSLPHFLYADPYYLNQTRGLERPSRDKYDTFVDLEPNTGMVLRGYLRAQLNLELVNWPGVTMFQKAPKLVFPFLWIEEAANLHKELVDDLKSRFLKPVLIVTIVKWTLLALSIVTTLGGAAFVWYKLRKSKSFV